MKGRGGRTKYKYEKRHITSVKHRDRGSRRRSEGSTTPHLPSPPPQDWRLSRSEGYQHHQQSQEQPQDWRPEPQHPQDQHWRPEPQHPQDQHWRPEPQHPQDQHWRPEPQPWGPEPQHPQDQHWRPEPQHPQDQHWRPEPQHPQDQHWRPEPQHPQHWQANKEYPQQQQPYHQQQEPYHQQQQPYHQQQQPHPQQQQPYHQQQQPFPQQQQPFPRQQQPFPRQQQPFPRQQQPFPQQQQPFPRQQQPFPQQQQPFPRQQQPFPRQQFNQQQQPEIHPAGIYENDHRPGWSGRHHGKEFFQVQREDPVQHRAPPPPQRGGPGRRQRRRSDHHQPESHRGERQDYDAPLQRRHGSESRSCSRDENRWRGTGEEQVDVPCVEPLEPMGRTTVETSRMRNISANAIARFRGTSSPTHEDHAPKRKRSRWETHDAEPQKPASSSTISGRLREQQSRLSKETNTASHSSLKVQSSNQKVTQKRADQTPSRPDQHFSSSKASSQAKSNSLSEAISKPEIISTSTVSSKSREHLSEVCRQSPSQNQEIPQKSSIASLQSNLDSSASPIVPAQLSSSNTNNKARPVNSFDSDSTSLPQKEVDEIEVSGNSAEPSYKSRKSGCKESTKKNSEKQKDVPQSSLVGDDRLQDSETETHCKTPSRNEEVNAAKKSNKSSDSSCQKAKTSKTSSKKTSANTEQSSKNDLTGLHLSQKDVSKSKRSSKEKTGIPCESHRSKSPPCKNKKPSAKEESTPYSTGSKKVPPLKTKVHSVAPLQPCRDDKNRSVPEKNEERASSSRSKQRESSRRRESNDSSRRSKCNESSESNELKEASKKILQRESSRRKDRMVEVRENPSDKSSKTKGGGIESTALFPPKFKADFRIPKKASLPNPLPNPLLKPAVQERGKKKICPETWLQQRTTTKAVQIGSALKVSVAHTRRYEEECAVDCEVRDILEGRTEFDLAQEVQAARSGVCNQAGTATKTSGTSRVSSKQVDADKKIRKLSSGSQMIIQDDKMPTSIGTPATNSSNLDDAPKSQSKAPSRRSRKATSSETLDQESCMSASKRPPVDRPKSRASSTKSSKSTKKKGKKRRQVNSDDSWTPTVRSRSKSRGQSRCSSRSSKSSSPPPAVATRTRSRTKSPHTRNCEAPGFSGRYTDSESDCGEDYDYQFDCDRVAEWVKNVTDTPPLSTNHLDPQKESQTNNSKEREMKILKDIQTKKAFFNQREGNYVSMDALDSMPSPQMPSLMRSSEISPSNLSDIPNLLISPDVSTAVQKATAERDQTSIFSGTQANKDSVRVSPAISPAINPASNEYRKPTAKEVPATSLEREVSEPVLKDVMSPESDVILESPENTHGEDIEIIDLETVAPIDFNLPCQELWKRLSSETKHVFESLSDCLKMSIHLIKSFVKDITVAEKMMTKHFKEVQYADLRRNFAAKFKGYFEMTQRERLSLLSTFKERHLFSILSYCIGLTSDICDPQGWLEDLTNLHELLNSSTKMRLSRNCSNIEVDNAATLFMLHVSKQEYIAFKAALKSDATDASNVQGVQPLSTSKSLAEAQAGTSRSTYVERSAMPKRTPSRDSGCSDVLGSPFHEVAPTIGTQETVQTNQSNSETDKLRVRFRCCRCDKPATLKCSACPSIYYCCLPCQVAHWNEGHSQCCRSSTSK